MAVRYKIAILLVIAMFLSGCGPYASVLRQDGYNYMQKGFESVPSSPGLHKVFLLNNLKIHIVDNQKQFAHVPFRNASVVGYATPFEIWVMGCFKAPLREPVAQRLFLYRLHDTRL